MTTTRNRTVGAAMLVAAGVLALGACGSNNNKTSPSATVTSAVGAATSGAAVSSSAPASATSSAVASGSTGGGGITCAGGSLRLAGSTAQANAMSEWIKAYQTKCSGASVNYGGGGSGAGVQQFTDGSIDFAGSDFPLSSVQAPKADARCKSGKAIDIPMVPGPIALGYNLPGVTSLNLSASTLAKIFSGKISKWDDPAIAKDNPGAKLPSLGIQTFHRSDGSGTSFNFTAYLAAEAKSDWTYGFNKAWKAPGGQGSKGTAGIAQGVKSTQGGIGYMELSFATQNNIPFAKVGNAGGKFVELTAQNVANFLSKASVTGSGNDLKLTFDYTNSDADAYPALLVTYEIVCEKGTAAGKLPLVKNFLSYTAGDGQQLLGNLGYVPLPANIDTKVKAAVAAIS